MTNTPLHITHIPSKELGQRNEAFKKALLALQLFHLRGFNRIKMGTSKSDVPIFYIRKTTILINKAKIVHTL